MSWQYLDDNLEACTFSPEPVAESLATCSLDTYPSALLRLMPAAEASCSPGNEAESLTHSPSGMMCEPSTATPGEEALMSSVEDFLAKTSVALERAQALKAKGVDSGERWQGSFAKWDHATSSWRTHQCLLTGDLELFSETWPRWGSMRNGESYQRQMPFGLEVHRAWITSESACGSSRRAPTLRATDGDRGGRGDLIQALRGNENSHFKMRLQTLVADDAPDRKNGKINSRGEPKLSAQVKRLPTLTSSMMTTADQCQAKYAGNGGKRPSYENAKRMPTLTCQDASNNGGPSQLDRNSLPLNAEIGGPLNPEWCEWFMGFPIGWTELRPSETPKSRSARRSHGKSSVALNSP